MKRKNPGVEREPKHEQSTKWTMKARPTGWDDIDPDDFEEDNPNKQGIPRHMIPDGMDMFWATDEVYGMSFADRRASFERAGWVPVHPEDFDGRFDGMFTPKGHQGEIRKGGQVLMARPMELSIRSRQRDRRSALEQVAVKEQGLISGDIKGVSLDTGHTSALKSNKINKSFERIAVPKD